jgi:hypothetical protein
MHEIRVTLPVDCISEATRLAREAGIDQVAVGEVLMNELPRRMLSVETSTPKARAFVASFMQSRLSDSDYVLTSREVRAIVSGQNQSLAILTRPMSEPQPDVLQDLWQLSHVTPSYVGRAAAGSILLADGLIHNNAVAIVLAALFLPFLSQVLAFSFGIWNRDRELIMHGVRALMVSAALALSAGGTVAWIEGGPLRFDAFRGLAGNLLISLIVGTAAGLSTADDAGRRYLVGVAAAVQFAVFPVWFGAAFVLGLPSRAITVARLSSFVVSFIAISASAMFAYFFLHLRRALPRG